MLTKSQIRRKFKKPTRQETLKSAFKLRREEEIYATLDQMLVMMNDAFKLNIQMKEKFVDLVSIKKAEKRPSKSKEMNSIYSMLSQNKANELFFEKKCEMELESIREQEEQEFSHRNTTPEPSHRTSVDSEKPEANPDDKGLCNGNFVYRRVYSRMVESVIRCATYYIQNKSHLGFLMISTHEMMKKLQICLRRIKDIRDLRLLLEIVGRVYEQNRLIEDRIYHTLVEEGHVLSLQEFFRVNGVENDQNQLTRRNSRLSISSSKRSIRLSVSKPIIIPEQETFTQSRFKSKMKDSRQEKTSSKKHNEETRSLKYQDKINKEIESNYAEIINKVSELVNSQIHRDQTDPMTRVEELEETSEEDSEEDGRQSGESSTNRLSKATTHQASFRRQVPKLQANVPKKPSGFQYFSLEFKDIIKDLDTKMGKCYQKGRGSVRSPSLTARSSVVTGFDRINNETISFQDPNRIAKMLGSRFSRLEKGRISYDTPLLLKKSTKEEAQRRNINNLLKIYHKRNNSNHVVDILFSSEGREVKDVSINGVQKGIRNNRINLLKDVGNRMEVRPEKEEDSSENAFDHENSQNVSNSCFSRQKRRMTIKLQEISQNEDQVTKKKSDSKTGANKSQNQKAVYLVSSKKRKNQRNSSIQTEENQTLSPLGTKIVTQKKNDLQSSTQQVNSTCQQNSSAKGMKSSFFQTQRGAKQTKRSNRSPKLSCERGKADKVDLQKNSSGIHLPLSSLRAYHEFQNPINNKYGYYGDQKYTSVRNSLEKVEKDIERVKKLHNCKENIFEVGSKFLLYQAPKSLDFDMNASQIQSVRQTNPIFQHKLIKQFTNNKASEGTTKHSSKKSQMLNELKGKMQSKRVHNNNIQRTPNNAIHSSLASLNRAYCLQSGFSYKSNNSMLNSAVNDELKKLILGVSTFKNTNLGATVNEESNGSLLKKIRSPNHKFSLPVSPRNSFTTRKSRRVAHEVYSTHKRVKIA